MINKKIENMNDIYMSFIDKLPLIVDNLVIKKITVEKLMLF